MKQNREWLPEYSRLSTTEILPDGRVSISNARNFTYEIQNTKNEDWQTIVFDPRSVMRAWFYVTPLSGISVLGKLFAHTFLVFEFEDGMELAFSIEARRYEGGEYNPFRDAVVSTFGLAYLWGTRSDFETRRTVLQNQDTTRYLFTLEKGTLEKLLVALLNETNNSVERPKRYHSIGSQCTNQFIKIFRKVHADFLPWHTHWYLTTLTPNFLARHSVLDLSSKQILKRTSPHLPESK